MKLKKSTIITTTVLLFLTLPLSGCLSPEPNNPEEAVNMYYTYIDEGKYEKAADLLYALQKGAMGSDYPQPLLPEDRAKIIQDMKSIYGEDGENIKIASLTTRIKRPQEESPTEEQRVITDIQRSGVEIYTIQTEITGTLNDKEVTLIKEHPVVDMGNWRIVIG